MRSGLSQVLQQLMKSAIGTFLARYRRSFAEVLHISDGCLVNQQERRERSGNE